METLCQYFIGLEGDPFVEERILNGWIWQHLDLLSTNHVANVSVGVSMFAQVGEQNKSATDASRQPLMPHENQTLLISAKNRAKKNTSVYKRNRSIGTFGGYLRIKG